MSIAPGALARTAAKSLVTGDDGEVDAALEVVGRPGAERDGEHTVGLEQGAGGVFLGEAGAGQGGEADGAEESGSQSGNGQGQLRSVFAGAAFRQAGGGQFGWAGFYSGRCGRIEYGVGGFGFGLEGEAAGVPRAVVVDYFQGEAARGGVAA